MISARRTEIQIALLIIGIIVWGYGQRIDEPNVRIAGIAVFAIATLLRFFKKRDDSLE